jgi:hypothetical protein
MAQLHADYFLLYKRPISESVLEYATDNFTKNNAKKLIELNEDKNKNELLIVIKELIGWYEDNLEAIKQDRFVVQKEDHIRSYNLLQVIEKQMSE